jgi:hypothetical protein
MNRGASTPTQPALPSPTAVVQTSWTEPAKPAVTVAAAPAAVMQPSSAPAGVNKTSASSSKPAEAYVTSGVIRWDDDEDTSASAPAHNLAELKTCVTKACGGLARDIEVSESAPRTLVVALRAAVGVDPQELTRTILSLEELDDYRVTLKWK